MKWANDSRKRMHDGANAIGNLLVEGFHYLGLFAIGAVTAWASIMTFMEMVDKRDASVDDILLLFIYLELGAMVGIYFKTNHPVSNIYSQCMTFIKTKQNHWLMA